MTLDILFASIVLLALSLRVSLAYLPRAYGFAVAAIVFVIAILPFPYGLSAYFLSYVSSFSISSVCVAAFLILCQVRNAPCAFQEQKTMLYSLIIAAAIVLYPSALGVFSWDMYAIGYSDFTLRLALLAIALTCLAMGYYIVVLVITFAFLGHALHLLVSDNLWDYVIDPFIVFVAAMAVLKKLMLSVSKVRHADAA